MRKVHQQVIYRYQQVKKPTAYITIPFPLIVFFLVALVSLFLFVNRFHLTPVKNSKIISYKPSLLIPTLMLHPQMKSSAVSPTKFPFLANVLSTKSAVFQPKPTSKPLVHIPVAAAQTNTQTANDYCLNVPVLLYHHIQPLTVAKQLGHAQLTVDSNFFDQQIAYLAANNYHTISADDLINALLHHTGLPAKSVLVTIDDGYDDDYAYGYQILKKYNQSGNFFIISGLLNNNGYMTWDQVKEISGNSQMLIYNHTWSHPALAGVSKEKIENEIDTANSQLESNTGKHINIFAYPYGSFSPLAIDVLKEKNFIGAFSTIGGTMQCESYIYTLRRIHIGNAPLTSYGF